MLCKIVANSVDCTGGIQNFPGIPAEVYLPDSEGKHYQYSVVGGSSIERLQPADTQPYVTPPAPLLPTFSKLTNPQTGAVCGIGSDGMTACMTGRFPDGAIHGFVLEHSGSWTF